MKYLTTLIVLLAASHPAFADDIYLKNGGKIVGIATTRNGTVVVELAIGTVTVPEADVDRIVPGRTILHDYYERYARIEHSRSAGDFVALATWAKANGVTRFVASLLETAIRLDPDHRVAREMLGFVFHEGRWMTHAEHMTALGLVLFRGEWVTPQARDAVLAQEAARREAARLEAARRKAESRVRVERETVYTLGLPAYGSRGSRVWSTGWTWPYWRIHWVFPYHGGVRPHYGPRTGGHGPVHHGTGAGHHGH